MSQRPAPHTRLLLCNSLSEQKWLYDPVKVRRGAIFKYACEELIVSYRYIFNYSKKKNPTFEYDVGVDFIQIRILIQYIKN